MARFETALKKTLAHEGGYSDVAGDRGGETYCGISRVNFPRWSGWEVVDRHKPLEWNDKIKDPELDKSIAGFYRIHKWNKIYGDNIHNQAVAEFFEKFCHAY